MKDYEGDEDNNYFKLDSPEEYNIYVRDLLKDFYGYLNKDFIKKKEEIDEYNFIDKVVKPTILNIKDKEKQIDHLLLNLEKYSEEDPSSFNKCINVIKNENKLRKYNREKKNREIQLKLKNDKIMDKSEDSDNNNSFSIFKNHDTYITENDLNNNVSKTISANPSNNSRMIRNKIFKINKKSNILNLKKEKSKEEIEYDEIIDRIKELDDDDYDEYEDEDVFNSIDNLNDEFKEIIKSIDIFNEENDNYNFINYIIDRNKFYKRQKHDEEKQINKEVININNIRST